MSRAPIPWFRHEPERTATGYRWLDWLTDPYWRFRTWWTARSLWKLMAVNESWRQARARTRAYFREHPELLETSRPERPSDTEESGQ